jgi:hypothetical protein
MGFSLLMLAELPHAWNALEQRAVGTQRGVKQTQMRDPPAAARERNRSALQE